MKQDADDTTHKLINKEISKVFVICTGGTLSMVLSEKGYVTQAGLVERLKKH